MDGVLLVMRLVAMVVKHVGVVGISNKMSATQILISAKISYNFAIKQQRL